MTENYSTSWNLQKYFYQDLNDPQVSTDFQTAEALIEKFITIYKGKIASLETSDWLKFFTDDDKISKLINKIGLYFFYQSSLNTQDQTAIKKQGEFDLKMLDISSKLMFISQEIKAFGFEKLMKLAAEPQLSNYKNFFVQKARNLKYILDEKTEIALNLKENSGVEAMNKLYEELTNSFTFKIEMDGETKEITEEEIRSLRMDSREEIRKKAYFSLHEVYFQKANQITLGNIYNSIVKDWTSELKIRGFSSVMSQRNISEEMPDEAVNLLFEEVSGGYNLYQKYLSLKNRILGGEGKISVWNLLAPINQINSKMEFNQALDLFLDCQKAFDPEFYDFGRQMFLQERVDVFPKFGKRGGAFASYEKDFPSFVLLNYTGKLRDASTIAHELGHAIHGYFSQQQSAQVYGSGLCLAETASIFNEMIFSEALLKKLQTPAEKIEFLDGRLQDVFATIFSQIMYVRFEKEVHETIAAGKELTYQDFNSLWRKQQKEYYGEAVEFAFEGEKEVTWSAIPHIFRTPFYCYSYSFGNLLTFSLYEKYLQDGPKFIESYKNILRSGGSKDPYSLLLENGLDITKKAFYQNGLKVVEQLVNEYEAAINSKI